MRRNRPTAMPMLARIDATATAPTNGMAAEMVPRKSRSTRPSRTSCTAVTSAACSRNMPTRLMTQPTITPKPPSAQLSSALMMAMTR
ncbi:MAG TPA: hypothetical protein VN714_14390 [Trebonia sp.]|nr:hypothetical protein [Trebonia sp.]